MEQIQHGFFIIHFSFNNLNSCGLIVLNISMGMAIVPYPGKTYYGPSVGAGCEVLSRDGKKNWTFEIFVPFRSSAFHDEYDALKNSGVEFSPDILPVTFTIGYNFSILAKAKNN